MKLVCPECKNDIELAQYPNLKAKDIIECNMCGITLMAEESADGSWLAQVVDEGK